MLKQSAFDREKNGRSPARSTTEDAPLDVSNPVLETSNEDKSAPGANSSKLNDSQTIKSESSAVETGVTKPRQRLNKLGASPEYNNAMKDIIKKSAEKKKVGPALDSLAFFPLGWPAEPIPCGFFFSWRSVKTARPSFPP